MSGGGGRVRIEPVCGRVLARGAAPAFGVLLIFETSRSGVPPSSPLASAGEPEFVTLEQGPRVVRALLAQGAGEAARSLLAAWFVAAAREAGLAEWEAGA